MSYTYHSLCCTSSVYAAQVWVGRTGSDRVSSWMGEHLVTAPVLNLKLGTRVNRVVVVDLSCASRVFLSGFSGFPPSLKSTSSCMCRPLKRSMNLIAVARGTIVSLRSTICSCLFRLYNSCKVL